MGDTAGQPTVVQTPGDDTHPSPSRPKGWKRRSLLPGGDVVAFTVDPSSGNLCPIPNSLTSSTEAEVRAWVRDNAELIATRDSEGPTKVAIVRFRMLANLSIQTETKVRLDERPRLKEEQVEPPESE